MPLTIAAALSPEVRAQSTTQAGAATLFQNVRIFDGTASPLSAPSNVLVKGNLIERISAAAISPEPGTTVIAGGGRMLMPGLIDNHWHAATEAWIKVKVIGIQPPLRSK